MTTSTSHGAVDGTWTALARRSPAQASRRAVLHLHAAGDPMPPADLASWFTERAFHFCVASIRLPAKAKVSARHAARDLRLALADLDAACAQLRQADGMASVIVTAQGRAAVAAALWADRRTPGEDGPQADALILSAPAWRARRALHLNIACPVLVIAGEGGVPAAAMPLGSHVTWLALPDAGADRGAYLAELGRWLGAYMYGQARDQLL